MEVLARLQPVTSMRLVRRFVDNHDYPAGGLTRARWWLMRHHVCTGTQQTELQSCYITRPHNMQKPTSKQTGFPATRVPILYYILRIWVSALYLSKPPSRCSHHSNNIDSQISLNQGVNSNLSSLNIAFSSSVVTYCVSLASLGFTSRSTSALMNRM